MLNEILKNLSSKFRKVESDVDLEWNRAINEAITIVKNKQEEIPNSCDGCQCFRCSGHGECDVCYECKNFDTHSQSDWWCNIRDEEENA